MKDPLADGSLTLRAALFDAAGTLIATARPVGEVYAELARAHGVTLPAERLGDAFRRILGQAPPMLFPGARAEEIPALERGWWRSLVRSTFLAADSTVHFPDFEKFFAELWSHYAEPAAWRARPESHAALRALRQGGLATGVVSNFDGRLPRILAGLGLAPLLDVVTLPGEARAAKPDPRIFALALARLGIAAGEAVYVGDDPVADVAAARAAGLAAVEVGSLATLADLPARLFERAQGTGG